MKNLIFILFALVAAENNSSNIHDSKVPILHVASCYPGMFWCRDPPYNYRCDTTSNLVQDRVHNVCEENCTCRWMQSQLAGPSATETATIVARRQDRGMQSRSEGPSVTETVAIVARPQDRCELNCAWGHGWCHSQPYSYRCDGSGRLLRDKGHDSCDTSCWCGCEESLREAALWDPVGKVEL
ncbi:hypothetical protein BKA56DRAFT_317447 [Ilyonectria sp. MPI-CAGE-AT-0026]|nr:hypothetical protein BKA56DRAFT_317447 [Ilyonectria sp. MPI-CAGE-AT-0026]